MVYLIHVSLTLFTHFLFFAKYLELLILFVEIITVSFFLGLTTDSI